MTDLYSIGELSAALLQGAVTLGLVLLLWHLHRRHRKPHFAWWAVALGARALSVMAIVTFMVTGAFWLLFMHQVFLAWTALGFLYAAQVFSRQLAWQRWYLWLLALPVAWAYVAIFVLDHFVLAALPAVLFLAFATLWAAMVFWRYRERTRSAAAGFLSLVLMLWAAHHLDYPLLRAKGAWNPWGYYIDILFVLAMGAGVLLLVIEEQREGLVTLTALSGDLRKAASGDSRDSHDARDSRDALLERPLGLRGVRGAALLGLTSTGEMEITRGVGDCAVWSADVFPPALRALALDVLRTGRSRMEGAPRPGPHMPPFVAMLPLGSASGSAKALAIVGDSAAPFAALDDDILRVVGEQVGSAMDRTELTRRLAQRTDDLERLSVRLLRDHEDQRRRLGQELHDETAQVFSALKLQLGSLRDETEGEPRERLDRLIGWVDRGSQSIRTATEGLRPAVLEDLGLVPALRALSSDVREWTGLDISFTATAPAEQRKALTPDAELAVFRTLQEALSNVVRHAQATRAEVELTHADGHVTLRVTDDGVGIAPDELARLGTGAGRSGLFGMQQRIIAAGGRLTITPGARGGLTISATLPAAEVRA